MSNYLKQKTKIFLLISVFLVVISNSYNYSNTNTFLQFNTPITQGLNFAAMFQYFLSNGIACFAVPAIYCLAGFVFFRSYKPTIKEYLRQLRTKALFTTIASIVWSVIALIFVLICINILGFEKLPFTKTFINSIEVYGVLGYFITPPNFQFAVIMEIMILFLYSPVIYLLLKYLKGFSIIPVAILWLIQFNLNIVNVTALLFFMLGAYISLALPDEAHYFMPVSKKTFSFAIIIWILLNAVKTYWAATTKNIYGNILGEIGLHVLHNISIILGILLVWYLIDFIMSKDNLRLKLLSVTRHSVFLFMFHEPVLHLSTQISLSSGNNSNLIHLALYFAFPISIIAISIILNNFFYKLSKPLHLILTGGLYKYGLDIPKEDKKIKSNN